MRVIDGYGGAVKLEDKTQIACYTPDWRGCIRICVTICSYTGVQLVMGDDRGCGVGVGVDVDGLFDE